MGKHSIFQHVVLGQLDIQIVSECECERMKLGPHLPLYTTVSSKWIKDLNLLGENISESLGWVCSGFSANQHWIWQWLLGCDTKNTGKMQEKKKTKNFRASKDYEENEKSTHRMGDQIFKSYI